MDHHAIRQELAQLDDGIHREPDSWHVCAGADRWMVKITPGLLSRGTPELGALAERLFVIADRAVWDTYGHTLSGHLMDQGVRHAVCVVPPGEEAKRYAVVEDVEVQASRANVGKSWLVLGVGGGATADLTRYFARTYRRGVPCALVATTPLAAIDGAIGLKAMVNSQETKNAFGWYSPALATFADPECFTTVPPEHRVSAFGEMVKMGLAAPDPELLALLDRNGPRMRDWGWDEPDAAEILRRSIDSMLVELQGNPRELDKKRPADLGHAVGKVLELRAGIPHGYSVAIDIALMLALGSMRDLRPWGDTMSEVGLMQRLGLPIWHPMLTRDVFEQALRDIVAQRGQQNLGIPTGGGMEWLQDVTVDELEKAATYLETVAKARGVE